ncbi:hypothetical protein HPTD01_1481 [Halomonas sp. TD01]|nr:hypothetical protein HPTD01_1481 [Halomonas sp. TD01]
MQRKHPQHQHNEIDEFYRQLETLYFTLESYKLQKRNVLTPT